MGEGLNELLKVCLKSQFEEYQFFLDTEQLQSVVTVIGTPFSNFIVQSYSVGITSSISSDDYSDFKQESSFSNCCRYSITLFISMSFSLIDSISSTSLLSSSFSTYIFTLILAYMLDLGGNQMEGIPSSYELLQKSFLNRRDSYLDFVFSGWKNNVFSQILPSWILSTMKVYG